MPKILHILLYTKILVSRIPTFRCCHTHFMRQGGWKRREPATVVSCKGNTRRNLCALTSHGWFGSGHPLSLLTRWWDLLQQSELWYGNEKAKKSTLCFKSGMEVPWLVRTHLYIVSQRDGLLWAGIGDSNNKLAHLVFCMRCSYLL